MFVSCAFYTQTVNLNHTVKTAVVWDIMACVVVMFIYEAVISTDFVASNGR